MPVRNGNTTKKAAAKKAASTSKTDEKQTTASAEGVSGESDAKAGDGGPTTTHPATGETVPTDPNYVPEGGLDTKPDLKVEIVGPSEPEPEDIKTETVDKDFIFVHHLDPMRRLPGGTYLDEELRFKAEAARAMVEDREPDFKNPPATQGTPFTDFNRLQAELPPVFDSFEKLDEEKSIVTLPVVAVKE